MLFTQMSNFWPDLRCSGQTAWNGGQSPATVVKGYFRNANRHDVKGMPRYCSNDFVFRDERSQFRMSKRDLRLSLEWDAVLHGKMTYEVIEEGPESAVVLVTESNDFFRLLKLDGQKLRVKFIVKGGLRQLSAFSRAAKGSQWLVTA